MIPEMKLGIVALIGTDGSESLVTTSALDILIPAFESWINEVQASTFIAPSTSDYSDVVGWYGIEGDDAASIQVYLDTVSGFPMMSIPDIGGLGLLTPELDEASRIGGELDSDTSSFVFNSQYSDTLYCFSTTLESIDGLPLKFFRKKNGVFQAFSTEGVFGVEFVRMDNERIFSSPLMEESGSKQWLRRAFAASQQRG